MVIVNAVLLFANQTRQRKDQRTAHKSFQRFGVQTHQERAADQARRHGVNVSLDRNGTKLAHRYLQFLARGEGCGGQRLQGGLFFGKACCSFEIAHPNQILQKTFVGVTA